MVPNCLLGFLNALENARHQRAIFTAVKQFEERVENLQVRS